MPEIFKEGAETEMKLEITKASEVKVKSVEWLWYPYIPYGKVTVIQGEAGDGKISFSL